MKAAIHTRAGSRLLYGPTALLVAALAAGCGYTTGLQLAPGHDTIGVELFRNDSPIIDLERDLHLALARSTRNLVDAPLVPPGQASVVVRGRILDFYRRGGVRTVDNELIETALTLRVESSLWDGRTGENLVAPVTSTVIVGYVIDGRESERKPLERALENVADAIVLQLLARPVQPPASDPPETGPPETGPPETDPPESGPPGSGPQKR